MGRVDAQPSAGLEAERAVLGAMLIDESIVSQVLAEVDERDISPQGFDYNDMEEGRLAGYVKHLLADKRYEELAEPLRKYSDGGNSHGPRLEMYRRMHHRRARDRSKESARQIAFKVSLE